MLGSSRASAGSRKRGGQPPSDHIDCIRDALRTVDRLLEEARCTAGAGPMSQMLDEHLALRGKRMRARLALQVAAAMGDGRDSIERAAPWAAACELLHNGTLILDDIQDGDIERRGGPSLWSRWGVPQAINAGAYLLITPYRIIAAHRVSAELRAELATLLAVCAQRLACGQSHELALAKRAVPPSWDDYCAVALAKTAGLFAAPVEGAALLAGATPQRAHALAAPFERLGLAFQLVDDLVDGYGDIGRKRGSDLRAGRFSALAIRHLEVCPEDRERLCAFISGSPEARTQEAADAMLGRFRDSGTVGRVMSDVGDLRRQAVQHPALGGQPELPLIASSLFALAERRLPADLQQHGEA